MAKHDELLVKQGQFKRLLSGRGLLLGSLSRLIRSLIQSLVMLRFLLAIAFSFFCYSKSTSLLFSFSSRSFCWFFSMLVDDFFFRLATPNLSYASSLESELCQPCFSLYAASYSSSNLLSSCLTFMGFLTPESTLIHSPSRQRLRFILGSIMISFRSSSSISSSRLFSRTLSKMLVFKIPCSSLTSCLTDPIFLSMSIF